MYNVIIHCLYFFLSCLIRNLTLSSLSRLFTIKIDVFFSVLQVLIPTVVFSMKAIKKKVNCTIFYLIVNILARNIVYTIPHYEELQSP